MNEKKNIILDKSFEFSLQIIDLYKTLTGQKEYVLSKQTLRAGTSIGANVEEAIGAFSKKEFASKMGIALKEARETRYWLRLLNKSQLVKLDYTLYLNEVEELVNILTAIVKTTQENNNKNNDKL